MFLATHSRVNESVSQSVSKSFNQSVRQTVEGYEQTNRIQTHSHNGFMSISCKYKNIWLGQSGSNDMYNIEVDTYIYKYSLHIFDLTKLL